MVASQASVAALTSKVGPGWAAAGIWRVGWASGWIWAWAGRMVKVASRSALVRRRRGVSGAPGVQVSGTITQERTSAAEAAEWVVVFGATEVVPLPICATTW